MRRPRPCCGGAARTRSAGHRAASRAGRRRQHEGAKGMTTRAALRRQGEVLRAELFDGAGGTAALAAPATGFDALMAELVYGSVWSRPGLSRQDRMACTLAALCAIQDLGQLRRHVAAALGLGLEPRAIL